MKKIFAMIITVTILLSAVAASAQTDFLAEVYPNYTSEYSLKVNFENSEELAGLIDEMDFSGEIENVVNLKELIKSLLSLDSVMTAQFDMSDDMKVIKAAITADTSQMINVNDNLSADVKTKAGMWMVMDFTDGNNPVYEIVYSYPMMNKYLVIDVFEAVSEEEKAEISGLMEMVMNKEFLTAINTFSVEVMKKYADIKFSTGKCIIKIDNDALINIIEEMLPYIADIVNDIVKASGDETVTEELPDIFNDIDLSGLRLLGDNGIKYTYTFKNGKMNAADIDADISVGLSEIYTMATGSEWGYISSGNLDFSVSSSVKISRIGSTKVAFPTLTEENSIRMSDMMPEYEAYPEYEDSEYPYWYVSGYSNSLPVIDGEIYVPLRQTLEYAYGESVTIGFENGVITAVSEYFPGFKTLTLTNGSDKVCTELGEFATKTVFIENGVTYVSSNLFTEFFGWTFEGAYHNMLTGEYSYDFYTQEW